jgi:hypothetical protein
VSLPTRRELQQARKLSQTLGLVILLLGVGAMAVYFLWPNSGARGVVVEVAYMVANIFFSAGLVAMLLSKVTFEEANLSAQATIQTSVESALSPIREALLPGSQTDYRWHCLLGMPERSDSFPEYAIQVVSIAKTVIEPPPELRFVCVASYADDALSPYANDLRYQLRWVVDEELDPRDTNVFDVLAVRVNGRVLAGKDVRVRSGATKSRLLSYPVPREFRNQVQCRIEFTVLLRKHVGNDARVMIRTQLFTTTFSADFRCVVAPNFGITSSTISSSEVSGLGSHAAPRDTVVVRPGLPADLHIRYDTPLQAGSTVGFHLLRDNSRASA